jgi:hypothetical protein
MSCGSFYIYEISFIPAPNGASAGLTTPFLLTYLANTVPTEPMSTNGEECLASTRFGHYEDKRRKLKELKAGVASLSRC